MTVLRLGVIRGIAVGLGLAAWSVSATTPPAKPAAGVAHKPATPSYHRASAKPATGKKPLAHTTHTAKSYPHGARTGAVTSTYTWHPRQLTPTPDRYQQIQQALASKGYLPPENANGKWDQNSVDALKHFQADQNMDQSGKINAQSLIHLGLGPNHEAAAAPPITDPPAPTPQANPER